MYTNVILLQNFASSPHQSSGGPISPEGYTSYQRPETSPHMNEGAIPQLSNEWVSWIGDMKKIYG